jgi:hypothetical protein
MWLFLTVFSKFHLGIVLLPSTREWKNREANAELPKTEDRAHSRFQFRVQRNTPRHFSNMLVKDLPDTIIIYANSPSAN